MDAAAVEETRSNHPLSTKQCSGQSCSTWGETNNLAPFALADLDELEQVGSTDRVQFTALADIYATEDQFGQQLDKPAALFDSKGIPVTPMMRVTKQTEKGVQSHLADSGVVLYQRDGFNSSDPANLTNFIKWSKQRFPAKHYALVVWDHGNGWLPGRATTAIVADDSDNNSNAMYIHEIQSAISNSGIHLDLLDFDACNMASVEVAYQLKDVTNFICSSQMSEPGNGNDYESIANFLTTHPIATAEELGKEIANFLTTHPIATAEELGKEIVNSYVAFYQNDKERSVTRSLIRTDKLAAVAGAVSQLTPLLSDPKVISSDELRSAFYEPIRFLGEADLCNFTNVLPYHVQNAGLNNALAFVRQKVHDAVVYNKVFVYSNPKEKTMEWGTRQFFAGQDTNVDGVGGLSIFLPDPCLPRCTLFRESWFTYCSW
jgi:hypothetical protein